MENQKVISLTEDITIGNILLEKGQKIKVLFESVMTVGEQTISDVCRVVALYNKSYASDKNIVRYNSSLFKDLVYLNFLSYDERYAQSEDASTIIDQMKEVKPSSNPVQLLKSLDCYLYQIEGSTEKNPIIQGLQRIADNFTEVLRSTQDYDKGYWGD